MYGPGLYVSVAFGLTALGAQYALIYLAASTVYVQLPACEKSFSLAYHGWDHGVCVTREQVWCQGNPGRHPDCATYACREEEIRLSLSANAVNEPTVYTDCLDRSGLARLRDQMKTERANLAQPSYSSVGPCVPAYDWRALYLPLCNERAAACRAPFYVNRTAPAPDCDSFWAAAASVCDGQSTACSNALNFPPPA